VNRQPSTHYLDRSIDLAALAPVYDEVTLWGARFLIHLLERIELRRGIRALDVGCASGVPLIELANVHGPSSRFTGIDMWSGALQQARKKIALQGLPNADLVEADGHRLPFRDGVFDLIVSSLGINNFDDPDAVFRECARIAKPGARLVLTTNVRGHMRELYDVFRALLSERWPQYLDGLEENEAHRGTPAVLAARIEAAGFRVTRSELGNFTLRFLDGSALLRHSLVYWFLLGWRAVVEPADEREVFAALEERLNALNALGELRMTVPMLYVEATSSS
jgi:arsenite methyltransferase